DKVSRLGLAEIADWCVVHLVNGDRTLDPRACAHVDPAKLPALQALLVSFPYAGAEQGGVQRVALTGVADLLTGLSPEELERKQVDPERRAMLAAVGVD